MNKTIISSTIVNAMTLMLSVVTLILFNSENEFYFLTATTFGVWVGLSLLINLFFAGYKMIKKEIKQAAVVIGSSVLCVVVAFALLMLAGVPAPTV